MYSACLSAQVRDAHNQPHMVKNLRLRFSEPSSEVPSMGVTKQTMHNIVLRAQPGGAIVPGSTLQVGNLSLNGRFLAWVRLWCC